MTGAPTDADARAEEAASDLDVEAGPDMEEEEEEEEVGAEQVASRSDLDLSRVSAIAPHPGDPAGDAAGDDDVPAPDADHPRSGRVDGPARDEEGAYRRRTEVAAPTEQAPASTASGAAPPEPAADRSGPSAEPDASEYGNVDDGPTFADLGLRTELLDALGRLGYEEPTPIQREAIPTMLTGRDLLGQAATGTGKTAAFALPILENLVSGKRGPSPTALVLVPTRELAIQVSEAVHKYGRPLDARVLPIYGGQPIFRQLRALQSGVDVVVATPGRAIDHMGRGSLGLDAIETVVLDEADEMLDMGFADDIEEILGRAPEDRQTVLFSATLPRRIVAIADRHLTDAVRIEIGHEPTPEGEAPKVRQVAYLVQRAHKATALGRILDVESPTAALVFCRTRAEVDQLTETLNGRGYRAEALHGGMDQTQRDRVMGRLRSGTADLLVATDVAARGLDVDQLTHVVNFDVPSAPEAYVHRTGRVGRAGREGVAITLAGPREHRQLKTIEKVTGRSISIEQVPSVSDLRNRRLELTRESMEEVLVADDNDAVRAVVESLSDEWDLMQIALAAVKMAHEATVAVGGDDEEDIPEVNLRNERSEKGRPTNSRAGKGRPERDAGSGGSAPKGKPARNNHTGADMTRLFVSAGREQRVRPGDLVGAIAGETSLKGRDIGGIDIQAKFSLVEVPSERVDEVIDGLSSTTLRGRKVTARRERY
ncbi:DEAD/DEAH box helicase [soil metagenome]